MRIHVAFVRFYDIISELGEVYWGNNMFAITTFILTLDGTLRSATLYKFCKKNNLNPCVVTGFDGRNKPRLHFKHSRHDFLSWLNFGRRLTNEEIACGLGHLKIYNLAKDLDSSWFLICEDDAFPNEGLVAEGIYEVLQDWDKTLSVEKFSIPSIIHLGPPLQGETDIQSKNGESGSIVSILNAPYGAYAYLINAEAIRLICDHPRSQDFISACDWPTQWVEKIRFFRTSNPKFLTTDFDLSYIEITRRAKQPKILLISRILFRLRLSLWRIGFAKFILKVNGFK